MAALASPPRLAPVRPLPAKGRRQMGERDRAQTALAFITSDERDVLELCFSAGCPPAEISRKLQIPLGAIKAPARSRALWISARIEPAGSLIPVGNFWPTFMNQTNPTPPFPDSSSLPLSAG